MIIHTAHLVCEKEHVDAFSLRLLRHAQTTLALEAGCKRFDIHQNNEDPSLFLLYEIYETEQALKAHRETEHFLQFRAEIADWVTDRTWWFWSKLDAAVA